MTSRGKEARLPELDGLLTELVATGGVSAAAAAIGSRGSIAYIGTAGSYRTDSKTEVRPSHLFDLASLTKPCIATLAVLLDRKGDLELETRVGEIWPRAGRALRRKTLADLLRHRAGMRDWTPLYSRCRSPERATALLLRDESTGARKNTYSDLGYILWARSAEERLGKSLTDLFRTHVVDGLRATDLSPAPAGRRTVQCELDNSREISLAWREGIRVAPRPGPAPGTVQDGNARFLGGLAGHAGLFSDVHSLWRFGRTWLGGRPGLTAKEVNAALAGPGRYALGWWRHSLQGAAGPALSKEAFGHVGFTGSSLWIDPPKDKVLCLLAHRTRVDFDPYPWLRRFHELAVAN